jgi:hypothetical protein
VSVRQAVVSGLYPELREKVEGKELVVYSAEPNVDVLDPSDEHGGRLKKLLDECEFSSDLLKARVFFSALEES